MERLCRLTGIEIRSIPHRDLHDGGTRLIYRGLQTAYDILQLLSDRQMLGAMLFTFAAFDAEGGVGPVLPHCRGHHIFHQSRPVFLSIAVIISRETAGDIHPFGTGLAIAAACTATFDGSVDGRQGFLINFQFLLR